MSDNVQPLRVDLAAHHDGSALYVPVPEPALGMTVPVRVRVPNDAPYSRVLLRSVADGEMRMAPGVVIAQDDAETWYEAQLLLRNPVTNYRFVLDRGAEGFDWLNATGIHHRDVPDCFDFRISTFGRAPQWSMASVVYQIFPDRFARSADADTRDVPDWAVPAAWNDEPVATPPGAATQFYGGDLAGIEEHLDHVQALGANVVYLTPVFPGRSNHRYDASTFDEVDEMLGGNDALASLADAVHRRGMRIVGDLTTNHTGDGHEWFRTAQASADSYEYGFYYWNDHPNDYASWLDVPSLPKLNWAHSGLAKRFIAGPESVVGRWLQAPFSLDGWRIDVANMTGRHGSDDFAHEVATTIRRTIAEINPDAVLVAEHFHDPASDLSGAGWQSAMNYSAFTRPVWNWTATPGNGINYLGIPLDVPRRPGCEIVATMREFAAEVPWQVTSAQWNNLGSHDTVRLATLVGTPEMVTVAATMLFTYPGVPMIFAGDEWGLTGSNGEHARVPMPWDRPERQDALAYATYSNLIRIRSESQALQTGGLRWLIVTDEALGYLREIDGERVMVLVARGPWEGATLPPALLGDEAEPQNLFGGAQLKVDDAGIHIEGGGPTAQIWRLS